MKNYGQKYTLTFVTGGIMNYRNTTGICCNEKFLSLESNFHEMAVSYPMKEIKEFKSEPEIELQPQF